MVSTGFSVTITMDSNKEITPVYADNVIGDVNSCRDLDQGNTVYRLSEDMEFPFSLTRDKCFVISADSVSLDGDGYSITTNYTEDYMGENRIVIYTANADNVIIKNNNLYHNPPQYVMDNYIPVVDGIGVVDSNNILVSNNVVENSQNSIYLIRTQESSVLNNQLIYNTVLYISPSFISLDGSSNNLVKNNLINGGSIQSNPKGIALGSFQGSSSFNQIIGNVIIDLGFYDGLCIYVGPGSNSNLFQGNDLCDSSCSYSYSCDVTQGNQDLGTSYKNPPSLVGFLCTWVEGSDSNCL